MNTIISLPTITFFVFFNSISDPVKISLAISCSSLLTGVTFKAVGSHTLPLLINELLKQHHTL